MPIDRAIARSVAPLDAVINAIVDALAEVGVRHIEMPPTTERVWRAIRAGRSAAALRLMRKLLKKQGFAPKFAWRTPVGSPDPGRLIRQAACNSRNPVF